MVAGIVLAFQLILVADDIPKLDVRASCRAGAGGSEPSYQGCLRDEKNAEDQLTKDWAQFSALDKPACVAQSQSYTSSYVTLLTCLQVARDARGFEKNEKK